MSLLSISIDLSNSTEVKDAFTVLSDGDDDVIRNAYANIYKEFYHWEFVFYRDLIKKSIPERSIFVMKTIGDEIWIVIDLEDSGDLTKTDVIGEVISSLNSTFLSRKVDIVCPTSVDHKIKKISHHSYLRKSIFFKIFIDVIEEKNLIDLSTIRAEVFRNEVYNKVYKDNESGCSENDVENFTKSINRFGVGSSAVKGKVVSTKLRKDYVGMEVDRFFRCTSFALPNLICVGRECVNMLKSQPNNKSFPVGIGVLSTLRLWNLNKKELMIDSFQAFRMPIIPGEMKGISGDYSVIYLFSNLKLLDQDLNEIWCTETSKILSKHGLTWNSIVYSKLNKSSSRRSSLAGILRTS